MHIVTRLKLCFPLYMIYVHVNIILDFPITYKKASVLYQSEWACLHQTVNMVVFFLKIMKIPTKRGEHSCKRTELSLKQKEETDFCFCIMTFRSLLQLTGVF